MKSRIIKRTNPEGRIQYTIQQKSWLFGWRDAWLNSWDGASCQDTWDTLQEAENNLCWFDGTTHKEEIIT